MEMSRTPQEEMTAWKIRVAELLEKEARCPGCLKLRKFAQLTTFTSPAVEGTGPGINTMTVCRDHERIRHQMAFPPRRIQ
jgi:hypothetical protein